MPSQLKRKTRTGRSSQTLKDAGELLAKNQKEQFNKLAPQVLAKYQEVVANWSTKTKPKFTKRTQTQQGKRFSSLGFFVEGTKHQTDIWEQLDSEGRAGGTRITPKNIFEIVQGPHGQYRRKAKLRYQKNYASKTGVGPTSGGSGTRSGDWIARDWVYQGAVEARKFTQHIDETFFREAFLNAARRAYRKTGAQVTGNKNFG